jgi:hypothetical protein
MYDSFAVIRWTQAGISPATIGVLWAESVDSRSEGEFSEYDIAFLQGAANGDRATTE